MLVFETFGMRLEATRGTVVLDGEDDPEPPTHMIPLESTLTPREEKWRPTSRRGTLAANYRSKPAQRWSEFTCTGALDFAYLPLIGNMTWGTLTSPATLPAADVTYDWIFSPNMTADNLKSGTLWWGDPNVARYRSAFGMIDDITISADSSGAEGLILEFGGFCHPQTKVTEPTMPTFIAGTNEIGVPGSTRVYLDTSSAIGTTLITDRFVSVSHHWVQGLGRNFAGHSGGPTPNLSFTRVPRTGRYVETTLQFIHLSETEYDYWRNQDRIKCRVIHYGDLVQVGSDSQSYYRHCMIDTYGTFDAPEWGDVEGDRTLTMTLISEYNTGTANDWRVAVRNGRATL